jgi:hypothetical protein
MLSCCRPSRRPSRTTISLSSEARKLSLARKELTANGPGRMARPITAVLVMAYLSHVITVGVRPADDLGTAGLPDGQAERPRRGIPGAVGDLDGEAEAPLR